jgi:FtsZ-binding cell division protein ZapB
MTEELLHHLWKFRLFNQIALSTTTGETIEIVKVGEHNHHAGPDFFNSKIKIDDTLWAGNVEVHIFASDWNKHTHQLDKSYDNIILHVVYEADRPIYRTSGEPIPTLELKQRIDPVYYLNYQRFKLSKDWVACEKQIEQVPAIIFHTALNRLLIERLEEKFNDVMETLRLNKMNWEETFYQLLAKNFGFKTNAVPFELLAKSTPSIVLGKHKSSLLQLEALLFGQAGFLEQHFKDKYPLQLQNEYVFLKQKFKLSSGDNHLWKFMRLRPGNFPTIRIAQFAQLIYQSTHLFSKIIAAEELTQLKQLLDTDVSTYWNTHYVFEKGGTRKNKKLGEDSIHNIIINTIVPFLFVYGKLKGDETYIERALRFLEKLDGEANSIINAWSNLNVSVKTAADTQALLQLKNKYCDFKRCLQCPIGNYLLKKV